MENSKEYGNINDIILIYSIKEETAECRRVRIFLYSYYKWEINEICKENIMSPLKKTHNKNNFKC